MSRTTIVVACVIVICGVNAMADDFELLRPGHPRLEMTPQQLEALRADEAAVAAARELGDDIIARERTTVYRDYFVALPSPQFPPEHSDRWPYWTGLAGELRRYLEGSARAWALTGERKYLAWCRDLMLAIARWPQWTDPWYGTQPCLDTHHLTRGMCVALDLTWEAMPRTDRAKLIAAIADRGAQFIFDYGNRADSYVAEPGAWPNGYAMINTELGVAALTLLGQDERAPAWLAQALDKATLFFDQQGGVDGGLVEGFGYGSAAVDNLTYLARTASAVVGVNLFEHPYLAQAIFFPAYFIVPAGGSLPAIGDNGGPEGCTPVLLDTARAMLEVEGSSLAAWYLMKAGAADGSIQAQARTPDLPLARHFRSIDWVAMRSGWEDTGCLIAFKSGQVAHHNHLDQNSLLLAWNDQWLLTDPGYQVYDMEYPPERGLTREMVVARHEYTYGTLGHNTILVDGAGQEPVPGDVTEFATTAAMDYAVGDASACYAGLSRYRRHVLSVPPDYVLIFDEIASNGPEREIELLLHTAPDGEFAVEGEPLAVGESRTGARATIARRGEAVARFVEPAQVRCEHRQHPHCEPYGHYLAVSPGRVNAATLAWVLAAGPRGSVTVEARSVEAEGGTAVQVRGSEGTDTVALANASREEVRAGDLAFTGMVAMVRATATGAPRWALVRGTRLMVGEATLAASDTPVTVGAATAGDLFVATIDCAEPAEVTLACPVEPGLVRLNGIDTPVDVTFDPERATVTLDLPAGSYRLEVRGL